MSYKLWLIWFYNMWSYKTINKQNDENIYEYDFFSIKRINGRGKHRSYDTFVAKQKTSTGIYYFAQKKFVTMDEMLDYIISLK